MIPVDVDAVVDGCWSIETDVVWIEELTPLIPVVYTWNGNVTLTQFKSFVDT